MVREQANEWFGWDSDLGRLNFQCLGNMRSWKVNLGQSFTFGNLSGPYFCPEFLKVPESFLLEYLTA